MFDKPKLLKSFSVFQLGQMMDEAKTERLNARMAELDSAHLAETKRLGAFITGVREKMPNSSKAEDE